MRRRPTRSAERARLRSGSLQSNSCDGNNGMFLFPVDVARLACMVSDGGGWDHVSVTVQECGDDHRCPTWEEMCYVRQIFFRDDETVMQLHPPSAENVNNHPYCLHVWRPQESEIPRPPAHFVGVPGLEMQT